MRNIFLKIALAVWIALWPFLIIRELAKGGFSEYLKLLPIRTLDERRSFVAGGRFYEFLVFCGKNLPKDASYGLAGFDEGSLEEIRAVYYLYPHLKQGTPDFMLVYNIPVFKADGYQDFIRLDKTRYILKRK